MSTGIFGKQGDHMKKIDTERWERRELYDFFSGMSQPFYSVTFQVDVTELYQYVKQKGLSFYHALVWLCTKAANRVENFRYTVREKDVWLLDERFPSFTELKKGAAQFHIVTMSCGEDLQEFCRAAKEKSAAQTSFVDTSSETDELIYFSCLPWIELTGLTNERDFDPDDNVPRIAWGKYTEVQGRKKLGMSLEVNHRFVDGYHVGRFYEELAGEIAHLNPKKNGREKCSGKRMIFYGALWGRKGSEKNLKSGTAGGREQDEKGKESGNRMLFQRTSPQ